MAILDASIMSWSPGRSTLCSSTLMAEWSMITNAWQGSPRHHCTKQDQSNTKPYYPFEFVCLLSSKDCVKVVQSKGDSIFIGKRVLMTSFRDKIPNIHNLKENRFFWTHGFKRLQIIVSCLSAKNATVEGLHRGELLTSEWPGSTARIEEPWREISLPDHATSDPPLLTRLHVLTARQLQGPHNAIIFPNTRGF